MLADLDVWQEQGRKIAGIYCVYAPGELIRAAGVVPVSLCGKKQAPIQDAERDLPAGFCPLIKSSYGYAITDTCPFFSFSDFLVAETTCDGKKKMYELMGALKPLHLMHLPHTQVGQAALDYWIAAFKGLENFLAQPDLPEHRGVRILLTGCPVGKGSDKVINLMEDLGARVVCMENCHVL